MTGLMSRVTVRVFYACRMHDGIFPHSWPPTVFPVKCQTQKLCFIDFFGMSYHDTSQNYRKNSNNWDNKNNLSNCPNNGIVCYNALIRAPDKRGYRE